MNWDRTQSNWEHFSGTVHEQWDNVTDRELGIRSDDTYAMSDGDFDDVPDQLTDWQQRLNDIERCAVSEKSS